MSRSDSENETEFIRSYKGNKIGGIGFAIENLVTLALFEERTQEINNRLSSLEQQNFERSNNMQILASNQQNLNIDYQNVTKQLQPIISEREDLRSYQDKVAKIYIEDELIFNPTQYIINHDMNAAFMEYCRSKLVNINYRDVKPILERNGIEYKRLGGKSVYNGVAFKSEIQKQFNPESTQLIRPNNNNKFSQTPSVLSPPPLPSLTPNISLSALSSSK